MKSLYNFISMLFVFALSVTAVAESGSFVVEGKVLDKKGNIIKEAAVGIASSGAKYTANTVTNEEGIFRFEDLPKKIYGLVIQKNKYKKEHMIVDLTAQDPSHQDEIVIRLEKKQPLVLYLENRQSKVKEKNVYIHITKKIFGYGFFEVLSKTYNSQDGKVKIYDLPKGEYFVSASIDPNLKSREYKININTEQVAKATIELTSTETVTGKVITKNSKEAVPSKVEVPVLGITSSTNESGEFSFKAPQGKWMIIVHGEMSNSKVLSEVKVTKNQITDLGTIVLGKGANAEIKLTKNNNPLAKTKVFIVGRNGFVFSKKSDKKGIVVVNQIPTGKYAIAVLNPRVQISRTLHKGDNGKIKFDVAGYRFRVKVKTNDQEVSGALVTVFSNHGVNPNWKLEQSYTNERGYAYFRALDKKKKYVFLVTIPTYKPHKKGNLINIGMLSDKLNSHMIKFIIPQNRFSGEVHDLSTRNPIRGAHVLLIPKKLERGKDMLKLATIGMARTGEKGKFEIKNIPDGTYHLLIRKKGYASIKKEVQFKKNKQLTNSVQLRKIDESNMGTLEGAVVNGKGNPTKALIVIKNKKGIPIRKPFETNKGGTFQIDSIPKGTYKISAEGETNQFYSRNIKIKKDTLNKIKVVVDK